MNAPVTTLLPIFATPFAVVSLPGAAALNPVLAALLPTRASEPHREPALPRDPRCFRSREDLFDWPHEAVAQLRGEILGGLCATVESANVYKEAEFDSLAMQARARFAIVRPDGCIPAGTVPMASWYAVYCVAAPPPPPQRADSGSLRLYAVRQGSMFLDAANWQLRTPFGAGHHVWRPVPGQMAIFPAWILHEIALNRTSEDLVLVLARARFAYGGQTAMPPW
jgi:hypothetical protein